MEQQMEELREINENLKNLIKSIGKGYFYDLNELLGKILEHSEKQTELLEEINARIDSLENTIENK